MTDHPLTSRPTQPHHAPDPRAPRRRLAHADVPSETLRSGLPDVGEGASAQHLGRDAVSLQAGEGAEGPDAHEGPNSGKGGRAPATLQPGLQED